MIVADYLNYLNSIAPFSMQEKYDNSGLLAGSLQSKVNKVLLCLDITKDVLKEALGKKVNLIISHHPLIFDPVRCIEKDSILYKIVKEEINVISAHTNLDIFLMSEVMLKSLDFLLDGVALRPVTEKGSGFGFVVDLPKEITADELLERVCLAFHTPTLRYTKGKNILRRIAICSGSGGDMLDLAMQSSDAYITGDVKWNYFIDAMNSDFMLIDAGHFGTEHLYKNYLLNKLNDKFPDEKIITSKFEKDVEYFIS